MIKFQLYISENKNHWRRTVLVAAVCMLTTVFSIQSQKCKDGEILLFTERFGIGSDRLYLSTNLKSFSQRLDSLALTDSLGRIEVIGYASIDGKEDHNGRLALGRATAVKDWLVERLPGYTSSDIPLSSCGHDWRMLCQLVIDDTEVPSRDRAIEIIESPAHTDVKIAGLRKLATGATWHYLEKHIFPYMRVAKVRIEYFKKSQDSPAAGTTLEEIQRQELTEWAEPVAEQMSESEEVTEVIWETVDCEDFGTQRLALKTNLAYDAVLMPSLEVEYKFNDRWSVGLEGSIAWWDNDRRHRYYRIMTLTPEVRYHFKSAGNWHGHYLGLFAGGGKYDFENGARGYIGNGGYLGVSYNYMWNVSKYFSLELGLGAGGMYTGYKEYIPKEGRYVYQRTNRMWYWGPLRVKFALVWRLWDVKCKERR